MTLGFYQMALERFLMTLELYPMTLERFLWKQVHAD